MEVQHGNSQQLLDKYKSNKFILLSNGRLGCGDLENLTNGSESRNYIN